MMASSRPEPRYGPPGFLKHRAMQVVVPACLLIPFFLPIPLELRRHPILGNLGDQAHVPLLAGITLVLYWFGPLRGRLDGAALGALALGGAIEFLQSLVGRAAGLGDFILDLAGVSLTVSFLVWKGWSNRQGLWTMILVSLLLCTQFYFLPGIIMGSRRAHVIFPTLADFEGPYDSWVWKETYGSNLEILQDDATGNATLLLTGNPQEKWPGAQMSHFPPDWSGFSFLKVDVRHRTPGKDFVPFTIRFDDFEGRLDHVWLSESFRATEEWQTFRFPLQERLVDQETRLFQLDDVHKLLFVLGGKARNHQLEIDNIRLEQGMSRNAPWKTQPTFLK